MAVKRNLKFYQGYGKQVTGPIRTSIKDAAIDYFRSHPKETSVDIYEGDRYGETLIVEFNSEPLELTKDQLYN